VIAMDDESMDRPRFTRFSACQEHTEGTHGGSPGGGAVDGGALGGDGQADAVASRGGGRERPGLARDATPSRVARRASAVDTRFRRLPR
jgi:hypothetical protein